ncbi:MAG: flagellar FliJ protein [Candidatus Krumholzibacteriia bacterium]|jgi:flagellar FliJ protein
MGFTFRLERIVQHRQRIIDERGRAVAMAVQKIKLIQDRLAELEQNIVLHQHQHLSTNGASVDVSHLMSRTEWVSHLVEQRSSVREVLEAATVELDNTQLALQEAWRNKEILERLREKQQEQWRADQAKIERQDLDEIGQIRSEMQRRAKNRHRSALSAARR